MVDDEAQVRDLHTRLVQQQKPDCRVLQAADGGEALEIMQQNRPDLVLLDLLMPEVDGFTVLEEMRASDATRDVPVIVLTSKALTEEDMERLNQGVAAVLCKGMFSEEEIGERIESTLTKNRALGTASQRLVRKAITFIQANFSEGLTRDQIAAYANAHPDHLSECFHQEMGITPMVYLSRYRIHQARKLLEAGGMNITEVAMAVGFADGAHFSRVFQREVGVSPRAYLQSKNRH